MTVRENMLPSAMVPGLVTVEDENGKQENVYPVDAKERINQGGWKLVENGAVEAARMAATPLRSGMAAGLPSDQIVAEVSGLGGKVIVAENPDEAQKLKDAGDNADAVPAAKGTANQTASAADESKADESSKQPKTPVEQKSQGGDKTAQAGDNKSGGDKK